jgi:hypothetical protein
MRGIPADSYRLGMTHSTATSVRLPIAAAGRLRTYGLVGTGASIVGAISAVLIIAVDPMVAQERFSYPLDATWYVVAQVFFCLQHLAMLPMFFGLLALGRRRPSRVLRVGTWVALVGQVVLAAVELVALTATHAAVDDSTGTVVGSLYSLPMLMLGAGLVAAGVGAARVRLFDGAGRWVVLGLGVYVFLVLFPAVFGPMVAGRVAIGTWLLMFATLGLLIARRDPT